MIAKQAIQILALATAVAVGPAAAQAPKVRAAKTADQVTPEAFSQFSKTMSSARESALRAMPDAFAVMTPEDRAASAPRYAELAGPRQAAQSAGGAGVEAAFTTSTVQPGRSDDLATRRRLAATAIANERVARQAPDQAKYRDPPRADDKGYYFSYAQTRSYHANRYTDRIGLYSSAYYELLRCRSANPVGLLGGNSQTWRRTWSWRVCPDAEGRYRPTL